MYLPLVHVELVRVSKAAQQRFDRAANEALCLACLQPLNGQTPIGGCHPKCHRATLRAIAAGKTTRDDRVREGKLLPRGKCGRKPSNPVSIELS